MAFLLMWIVIHLGISGYTATSDGGNFGGLSYTYTAQVQNGTRRLFDEASTLSSVVQLPLAITPTIAPTVAPTPTPSKSSYSVQRTANLGYKDWQNSVCATSPYYYLRPFKFTFTTSSGQTSSLPSYCAYPESNFTFRFCMLCFAFVTIFILYFKTPISFLARQIWLLYALLFFAIFVLDVNATIIGGWTCNQNFANTKLHDDMMKAGVTITCDTSIYAGVTIIDLIICVHFFFLYTAWALTKDLYIPKGGPKPTQDQKTLMQAMQNSSA